MVKRWVAWLAERPNRWEYARSMPLRQMTSLLLAVFLLFSVLGFFNDLMDRGTGAYIVVILNAAFGGMIAVLWLIVLTRRARYWLIGVAVVQWFSSPVFHLIVRGVRHVFHPAQVPPADGIRFAAISIVVCVMASYSLFVHYIRSMGRESMRLRTELDMAHAIQKTLVPVIRQRTPCFEIYGISQPSEKVGGDLVDALTLPGGDTVAYVADIAGHGLPAGILMGMLKTAARTALRDHGAGQGAATLSMLMERLDLVLPEVKEQHMYATLTALRLNADGRCFYGMAACPPMLHWQADGKTVALVEDAQFPLGLLPVGTFPSRELLLSPGDVLLVATDGILEVCSKGNVEFGVEALAFLLQAQANEPLEAVAAAVLAAVAQYGKQQDDQTLLLVRRTA